MPALKGAVAATSLLLVAGCVTKSDLADYATKSDLEALRSELMTEIQKTQADVAAAQQSAAAAAAAAERAAADAKAAAEKADAIFQKSLRK
jgi:hypothetical protein